MMQNKEAMTKNARKMLDFVKNILTEKKFSKAVTIKNVCKDLESIIEEVESIQDKEKLVIERAREFTILAIFATKEGTNVNEKFQEDWKRSLTRLVESCSELTEEQAKGVQRDIEQDMGVAGNADEF